MNENDLHPCKPLFTKSIIATESAKKVQTKGILETTRYIRYVLKVADWLLAVGGTFEIFFYKVSFDAAGYPLRPQSYLMNEVSLCFKNRFRLVRMETEGSVLRISLVKDKSSLPPDDHIDRWSFGIVSDGRKNDRILNIIHQIKNFNIPVYEILICGPSPSSSLPEYVKVLDDSDLYNDVRTPISKKKNRIIQQARYNNLVIIHDRISFHDQWYSKMIEHGNYFDQMCMRILDESSRLRRIQDWMEIFHDITLFEHSSAKEMSYTDWSKHIYVNGGALIIKKHIIEEVLLNPNLHWGEMEDVDLSERLYSHGSLLTFFRDNYLVTQTHRISGDDSPNNFVLKMIFRLRVMLGVIRRNKKIKKDFYGFLQDERYA